MVKKCFLQFLEVNLNSHTQLKLVFLINISKGGNHKFCFITTTKNWISTNKQIRFGIRLVVGEGEEKNYDELAKV